MSNPDTQSNEDKLKVGDIVLNGWASPGVNDLHIITGYVSVRGTRCYETLAYFEGKLGPHKSRFSTKNNKLSRIGYFDFKNAMQMAVENAKFKHDLEQTL